MVGRFYDVCEAPGGRGEPDLAWSGRFFPKTAGAVPSTDRPWIRPPPHWRAMRRSSSHHDRGSPMPEDRLGQGRQAVGVVCWGGDQEGTAARRSPWSSLHIRRNVRVWPVDQHTVYIDVPPFSLRSFTRKSIASRPVTRFFPSASSSSERIWMAACASMRGATSFMR